MALRDDLFNSLTPENQEQVMRRAILSQPIHPIESYEEMLTDEKLGAFELYRDKKPKKPHGTGLAIAVVLTFLCIGILAALGAWWR